MQSLELALRSGQKSYHEVLILGRSLSSLKFLFLTDYLSKTNENPEERNPYLWRIMTIIPLLLHLLLLLLLLRLLLHLLLLLLVVFRDIKVYSLKKWNLFFATRKKHLSLPNSLEATFSFAKKLQTTLLPS